MNGAIMILVNFKNEYNSLKMKLKIEQKDPKVSSL